jgi:hypothetical protein
MPTHEADCRATSRRSRAQTQRWLMRCRLLVLLPALLVPPEFARAQLTLSGGIEMLNWDEDTSPTVSESGPMLAFRVAYTQQSDTGWLFGYRGKIWGGTADYTGSTLFGNVPVTGRTGYFGIGNEVQARFRSQLKHNYRRDFLAGLGLDLWRRELSSIQSEDYKVIYARAGFEIDSVSSQTWLFALGLKYPLWVREDAHLNRIGFDRNPELSPDGKVSLFGHVGYRFSRKWNIVGYVDSYRFDRSKNEAANEVANGFGPQVVFQPASDMLLIGIRLDRDFP